MIILRFRCVTAAAVCLAFLLGCGGSGEAPPKTYPVSGSVVFNGEPVVGAKVAFMSEKSSQPATGLTDKDGKFQLSTYTINDGAIAGEHTITVVKEETTGGAKVDPSVAMDPSKMMEQYTKQKDAGLTQNFKLILPAKYASQSTSPLKVTVKTDGLNQFPLQLSE